MPKRLLCFHGSLSLCGSSSAFGKLGELSKKQESMQRLYLWQQQEASYMMLKDFSGRPDRGGEVDFEPEM
jgi:hypothetical protein